MTTKTSVARAMRNLGLGRIVDSKKLRETIGVPVYGHQISRESLPSTRDLSPTLTVVVPAYNVAEYLPACLDSVLGQSFTNLDVLVINDGSTDDTGQVADDYARRHRRVRVIHQPNAGLGAARNRGLDESSSEFITFVDSDDTVPTGTYERAMRSLQATNSDVCIGSVSRFDQRNKWLPFWVHLAHDKDRYSTTGQEFPEIMWDVFAWNKVYRRATWNRLVGRFPEGTLYEDQECTARLFVGGAKLDVLKDVGYNWRLRDDNSSITQQKTSVDDLRQRLDVVFKVRDIIDDAGDAYISHWYAKTLGEDLYFYIREVPRASDEFFELLSTRTALLWDEAPESAISSIDPVRRILTYYVSHKSREELEALLVHLERTGNAYKGTIVDGLLYFSVGDIGGHDFSIPTELQTVVPQSIEPRVQIESYASPSNGDIVFTGFGFLPNFDAPCGYSADLFDPTTGSVEATLEVTSSDGPVPPNLSSYYHDYRNRRFILTIPRFVVDSLAADLETSQGPQLELRFHLHLGEYTWTVTNLKRDLHSSAGYPPASSVTDRGARLAFQGDPRQHTSVLVLRPTLIASRIEIVDNELVVQIDPLSNSRVDLSTAWRDGAYLELTANSKAAGQAPIVDVDDRLEGCLALPCRTYSASKSVDRFDLHIVNSSGMRWALAINRGQASRRRDQDFVVGMSGFGYAVLDRPVQAATATGIGISEDGTTLTVTGSFTLEPAVARSVTPTFALVGTHSIVHPNSAEIDHGQRKFKVAFQLSDPKHVPTFGSIQNDSYILQVLLATGKSHPAAAWIAASYSLEDIYPQQILTPSNLITINTIGRSRSVRIDLSERLDPASELGRKNQASNSTVFISPRSGFNESTVLFESFAGSAVADSPLAIDTEIAHKFPGATRLWTVRNPTTAVPNGAQKVIFGSREWFTALSTSKVLVNNNNFPHFFHKHPDQVYLQTWHGTPLKKIGNHVPPKSLSLSYRKLMQLESQSHWDLLLAQSEWAGNILREAFDYSGTVLEAGYPRNDVLASPSASASARLATRRRLGIGPEQRVILYAPTWRDDLKEPSGHYSRVDYLDVANAAKVLGSSSTILYRGHSNSLDASPKKLPPSVIDTSRYSDINDLIAASDILVTDYSSIMFDYVVTGRPIVFLCPDMEVYRDAVRGFYLDFEAIAPGPIVQSSGDALDVLRSDEMFSVDATERYTAFVNRFAGLDDGYASKRVVERLSSVLGWTI
ncbi:bifunctional glycosyltransferase/CDP-glycerol:glycerophosphate glycerophosphotransferase [Brevibacterium zhoupengii]|uniref:bifunctional glycosyltransferase/CDP-glycerol:glycerophosphate glycerophosphotransferase n=1 Tax=Brevibacterium zhoupengii TaxID=2898795 RepID=UPI001E524512|nr:CDP-glycerol glycerophosphotransferase family protein [Brevibacterium zhoupengii]